MNAIIETIDGQGHDWIATTIENNVASIKSECGITDYPAQLFIDGHLHRVLYRGSDKATYLKA